MIDAASPVAPAVESLFVPETGDSDHEVSALGSPASDDQDDLQSLDDILQDREPEDSPESAPQDSHAPPPGSTADMVDSDSDARSDQEQPVRRTKSHPPRKASKKALEAMNRETQRMTREMNLQHEVKTRKTFSLTGFLSKFAETADEPAEVAPAPVGPGVTSEADICQTSSNTVASTPPASSPKKTPLETTAFVELSDDSDSDLEIVPSQPPADHRFDLLDQALARSKGVDQKSKEQRQMVLLRNLANITSPPKPRPGIDADHDTGISSGQLMSNLKKKARQQALVERESRIQQMKEQGLYFGTSEAETEQQYIDGEDILERGRAEARRLAKLERGELGGDDVDSDSEEDEQKGEYVDPDEWDSEMEEEEEDGDMDIDDADTAKKPHPINKSQPVVRRRAVMDDDDEVESAIDNTPRLPSDRAVSDAQVPDNTGVGEQPSELTQEDSYAEIRRMAPPMGSLSLSQVFAGTLGAVSSSMEDDDVAFEGMNDPLPGAFAPQKPSAVQMNEPMATHSGTLGEIQVASTPMLPDGYSQINALDTNWTMQDPTQDGGFEVSRSPVGSMADTQETVAHTAPRASSPSEISQRKRKRERNEEASVPKKVKKKEKPSAELRVLLDEEAELTDSDLAEFSDENEEGDSDDGDDAGFANAMIDDDTQFLAADQDALDDLAFAQRKKDDDKFLKKLARDVDTGGLRELHLSRRRKGGDGLDFLSDDSDDEAFERRRRRRQLEAARMRRALLASDERVAGMAKNPKQEPFLRAMEDLPEESDSSWLHGDDDDSYHPSTASATESEGPDSRRGSVRSSRAGSPVNDDDDNADNDDGDEGDKTSKNTKAWSRTSSARSGLERVSSRLRYSSQPVDVRTLPGLEPEEDEYTVELSSDSDDNDNDDSQSSTRSSVASLSRTNSEVRDADSPAPTTTTSTTTRPPSTTPSAPPRRGHGPILLRRLAHKNLNRLGSASSSASGSASASSSSSYRDPVVERRDGNSARSYPTGPNRVGSHHAGGTENGASASTATAAKKKTNAPRLLGTMLQSDGFD